MKVLALVLLAALANTKANVLRQTQETHNEYKLCVPEELMELCKEMAGQTTKSLAKIICIPARSKYDCIGKIKKHEADFAPMTPEDMYMASKWTNDDLKVIGEIRTLEEPDAEYRYEAVAVIHKNLNISNLTQIKGLKSCHTGVDCNVGYKIPLTKLKNMGIIGKLNEENLSPRENELEVFSTLFSKACIVGKWSPDPTIDTLWKQRYSNLCEMCEDPTNCNYPDKFSGYEGALRCLAHNGGQIAWTKAIYVRKFFGLPVGISPAKPTKENPSDFAYLCPDGSKVPVTEKPCTWAAHPWPGYIANTDVIKTVDELRKKIENLNVLGHKLNAKWLGDVLEIGENNVARQNKIMSAKEYLDKAKYTDVLEREYKPSYKTIRFCTVTSEEFGKCEAFSRSAFSRNIRPRFTCVHRNNVDECLEFIKNGEADIITIDGPLIRKAVATYKLVPIVSENYDPNDASHHAVAVVRKNSSYQSFADLRGAKSCHSGRIDEYNALLYTLKKLNLIEANTCPTLKSILEYFSGGSCMPGANDTKHGLAKTEVDKLCNLCAGDKEANDISKKCNFDSSESYSGYTGAFRCLVEGGGDVAFVKHVTVPGNTNSKNTESWAVNLKSEDYELLCPDGGRMEVDQFEKCNVAIIQSRMRLGITGPKKSEEDIQEIQNALISASEMYSERPDWFKMFGSFKGKKDLLFSDSATGLSKTKLLFTYPTCY